MKLSEAINKAYEQEKQRETEAAAKWAAERERKIIKFFENLGVDNVLVTGGDMVTDGEIVLKALFYNGRLSGWRVQGDCPGCGKLVWSSELYGNDLLEIGRELADFQPDYSLHDCELLAIPHEPDASEAHLISAIKTLVREVLNERASHDHMSLTDFLKILRLENLTGLLVFQVRSCVR